jgi:hypothetical protein
MQTIATSETVSVYSTSAWPSGPASRERIESSVRLAPLVARDVHAKRCDLVTTLIVPRGWLFANPRKAWPTHPFGGRLPVATR